MARHNARDGHHHASTACTRPAQAASVQTSLVCGLGVKNPPLGVNPQTVLVWIESAGIGVLYVMAKKKVMMALSVIVVKLLTVQSMNVL